MVRLGRKEYNNYMTLRKKMLNINFKRRECWPRIKFNEGNEWSYSGLENWGSGTGKISHI